MTLLETFVAAVHRETDLAEELDRTDEAPEAEVDEETPSPAQATTAAESPRQSGAPKNWRILSHCDAKCSMPPRSCQVSKTFFQMSRVRSSTDAENSASSSFAEMLPFQSGLRHRNDGSSESAGSRKPNPNIARHLSPDTLPPGRTQAGRDSNRDLLHIAIVLAQT